METKRGGEGKKYSFSNASLFFSLHEPRKTRETRLGDSTLDAKGGRRRKRKKKRSPKQKLSFTLLLLLLPPHPFDAFLQTLEESLIFNHHSNDSAALGGATCVQRFDDSQTSAIHITYHISLCSSSLHEPRDPSLKVVSWFLFFFTTRGTKKKEKTSRPVTRSRAERKKGTPKQHP